MKCRVDALGLNRQSEPGCRIDPGRSDENLEVERRAGVSPIVSTRAVAEISVAHAYLDAAEVVLRRTSLPNARNPVRVEGGVGADESQPPLEHLCCEEPVERVPVMKREGCDTCHV